MRKYSRLIGPVGRLALAAVCLVLAACGPAGATPTMTTMTATTATDSNFYVDAKLKFQVTLPVGWVATPYPGTVATPGDADVVFADTRWPAERVEVGVMRGPTMAAAFAARGVATASVGPYPAFVADTTTSQGRVPCLVRIFLAQNDYVVAEWCAMDASSHAAEFMDILASYRPAATANAQPAIPLVQPPQTCSAVQIAFGYKKGATWGRALAADNATAPDGGWRGLAPGVAICSNTGSPDQYLFQCTELINRYDATRLGLPHLPGNAARYFDYYQDGTQHPGVVRDLPTGTYALADDANQGTSAFAPAPGDLLVFQDVASPRTGWTSGLIQSAGHVALIVGVDATHVYVAQENFNDQRAFMALPLAHTANGYTIADLSGLPNRITRGWIRFTP